MPDYFDNLDPHQAVYYDEDHSPSGNPSDETISSFITMLSIGAIGSIGFANAMWANAAVAAGVAVEEGESGLFISWELSRLGYIYGASPEAVELAAAVARQGPALVLTAQEQALVDYNMARIMNAGIQSAGCIFFPSGL